jgi:iron-sulfur cluster assembly protein
MQQAGNSITNQAPESGASSGNVILLTPAAKDKIMSLMKKDKGNDQSALRVSVVGGGCSGFSYKMGFEDAAKDGDQEFIEQGVRVLVDQKSALFIKGLQIDYVDGLNGAGFVYENPKAAKSCGCGTSFSV